VVLWAIATRREITVPSYQAAVSMPQGHFEEFRVDAQTRNRCEVVEDLEDRNVE
jgi:hypothetical protein